MNSIITLYLPCVCYTFTAKPLHWFQRKILDKHSSRGQKANPLAVAGTVTTSYCNNLITTLTTEVYSLKVLYQIIQLYCWLTLIDDYTSLQTSYYCYNHDLHNHSIITFEIYTFFVMHHFSGMCFNQDIQILCSIYLLHFSHQALIPLFIFKIAKAI